MEKTGENYHSPSILHSDKLTGLNPRALSKWKKGQARPHELCVCLSLAIKTQWKILVTECMICCGPQKGEMVCLLNYSHGTKYMSSCVFFFSYFSNNESSNCFSWSSLAHFSTGWQRSFSFFPPSVLHTYILLSLSPALFWSEFDKGLVLPLKV